MSLPTLLNRTVTVRRMSAATPATRDRYGDLIVETMVDIVDVPARRDQTAASEDEVSRDQQTRLVMFTLALRSKSGVEVAIGGRDRIVDAGVVFEVVGEPELIYRRRVAHHWEARADRVEG